MLIIISIIFHYLSLNFLFIKNRRFKVDKPNKIYKLNKMNRIELLLVIIKINMNSRPVFLSENIRLEESKDQAKLRMQHQIKVSIDSISSASASESLSLSCSDCDSADSEDIQRVSAKTKEIKEMVSNRLNAFLHMSQKCCEENIFINEYPEEAETLKKSLDNSLSQCRENNDKTNEIVVKSMFEQIFLLDREYKILKSKLSETASEMKGTDEEETQLKGQMQTVEGNISKFLMETQENNEGGNSCQCIIY